MDFFLVDDDPIMIKLLETILSRAGHSVTTEDDSNLALDRIRSQRPDCVITDLMMPGVDGYQLITQIRNESDLADTTIIVLSSKMFPQDLRQAIEFGANGFIKKPVDPVTFLDQVNEILNIA